MTDVLSSVCGIERVINKQDQKSMLDKVIPIAGELKNQGGGVLDAKWILLSNSGSHADSEKEGLRLEAHGGFFGSGKEKKTQTAIVEFLCDKERTGLENLWNSEDQYTEKRKRADGDASEPVVDDKDLPSLTFVKYDTSRPSEDILRLEWRTKHACVGAKEEKDAEQGHRWGFFTWFILIAFLSTATYLIFGSWLNYNRYGARGWDLLPHGDTIRDVPYLLKDWIRRVVNTVQGGGSRGGYAAV
ncbi:autophagy protein Atg27 [Coleophoma cylindrospora]|uniref:Autophagy protein Atg27 n=1 Tax=Coleophoma cylindrospora TaxID=1849047 RepID=A0A3D8RLS0_9HELO|nr:autophagy protein Atg27 [Coleophoma cylindrospora]